MPRNGPILHSALDPLSWVWFQVGSNFGLKDCLLLLVDRPTFPDLMGAGEDQLLSVDGVAQPALVTFQKDGHFGLHQSGDRVAFELHGRLHHILLLRLLLLLHLRLEFILSFLVPLFGSLEESGWGTISFVHRFRQIFGCLFFWARHLLPAVRVVEGDFLSGHFLEGGRQLTSFPDSFGVAFVLDLTDIFKALGLPDLSSGQGTRPRSRKKVVHFIIILPEHLKDRF